MNQVKKYKLLATEAIKFNGRPYYNSKILELINK